MQSNYEKMISGKLFLSNDQELKKITKKTRKLIDKINKTKTNDFLKRRKYAKDLFESIGNNLNINKNIHVDYGINIAIGNNFYANYGLVILDLVKVSIGNNVMFGPNVHIYTATHPITPVERRTLLELAKPVTIGNDVWIGGNVTINPGLTIGNNVVIGSGAVVTKSFEDNVIVAGNPAKVIRKINEEDQLYWQKEVENYYLTLKQ